MIGFVSFPTDWRVAQPGFYVIRHCGTGLMYVGSTGNLYRRRAEHLSDLNAGHHRNGRLQEVFNNDTNIEFWAQLTQTREDAYAGEQSFMDQNSNTGLLLNIAQDVKLAWKGLRHSEESIEKMRTSNAGLGAGRKLSEQTIQKIKDSAVGRVPSEAARKALVEKKSKSVIIDGVVFSSISEAGRHYGVPPATIFYRLNSTSDKFKTWMYVE